jgi:hypothetical protein
MYISYVLNPLKRTEISLCLFLCNFIFVLNSITATFSHQTHTHIKIYIFGKVSITNMMVEPHPPPNCFTYDSVHGEDTIQIDFYNTACRPLVDSVLRGFNGTIFAYGQTGCGKVS